MFSDLPKMENNDKIAINKEQKPLVDLIRFKIKLKKMWWLFLITITIACFIGFYYIKSMVPIERVTCTVLFDDLDRESVVEGRSEGDSVGMFGGEYL